MKYKKIIIFIMLLIATIPLSVIISSMLHFSLTEQMSNISPIEFMKMLESVIKDNRHLKIFVLIQSLVILFLIVMCFITKDNMYASDEDIITENIRTPVRAGQGQYGNARWLKKGEIRELFSKNELLDTKDVKSINFDSGGLVVGYEKKKKSEEIYYIDSDTHSLTVGATRSGKTRTIVIQSIMNLALAGESIIISDPKGELYHYTSNTLKDIGYETIVLDFKSPQKSNSYNFLQPIIDCVNNNDYRKAEEYAWDITLALVGTDEDKGEKLWKNGEMSIIAGAIMSVVYENKEYPQYQNLTNVYTFISEMCRTEDEDMPLNEYINDLDVSNPASRIFNIARIAPDRTRGSFFTQALTTLRLFTSDSIYSMTCSSDFNVKETGSKKRVIYIILPDDRLAYYPIASMFVNQQYSALVDSADTRGGELENRVNFILDEFGNFTTISGFSNMLTVGGGRRIRFNLFLQSFSQLEQKYGKENAENILDNCQTWIYLKTASTETAVKIMKKLR